MKRCASVGFQAPRDKTTQIYVFDAETALVLGCVTPDAPWFLPFVPGTRMELLQAAANSKAIWAFFDKDVVYRLLGESLRASTPNTIIHRDSAPDDQSPCRAQVPGLNGAVLRGGLNA